MNDSRINNIKQIEEYIKVAGGNGNNENCYIEFKCESRKERYAWINQTLDKFQYLSLCKKDKGTIRKFIQKLTSISNSQLTRLIVKKRSIGEISSNQSGRNKFSTTYTAEDVSLIVSTDNAHSRLSGKATRKIFEREYKIFGKTEYVRLQNISVSHIYNLRGKRQYLSNTLFWQKTKPTAVNIGKREKPQPCGITGFIRVDTVHQGDLNGKKGVYHLNFVDEVTQWELVACVEKISEFYLIPILEEILKQFPFLIINFHSDNGSEFINKVVARILNRLLIKQTKSRARRCNDNALVEGKNGSVIRKHMGRNFISQKFSKPINEFYENHFNAYLNFHRPCGFATEHIDLRGKVKKKYDIYMTPYEKFKSLENCEKYLKPEIRLVDLDKIAYQKSDNEFATLMQEAKEKLFKDINQRNSCKNNHKFRLSDAFSKSDFMLIS